MMGTAVGSGEGASIDAAKKAINSPLMEEGGILGARGVLINITASSKLSIHDVNEACNLIRAATRNDDVQINFGVVMDESLNDQVKITVIATGFQRESLPEIRSSTTSVFDQPMNGSTNHEGEGDGVTTNEQEQAPIHAEESADDLEMPAFLRKKRQLVQ